MTTFTTEDRKAAYDPGMGCVTPSSANGMEEPDLVAEAPYHPGYEDAVINKNYMAGNIIVDELNAFRKADANYKKFTKTIIEFMKGGQKWER